MAACNNSKLMKELQNQINQHHKYININSKHALHISSKELRLSSLN